MPTRTPHPSRSPLSALDVAVAIGLMAGSSVLRRGPLAPPSLWSDDAWVALTHKASSLRELRLTGATAPGFSLLEGVWLRLVGFSELHAQALPFVAGIVGPAVLYAVALRLGLRRWAALVGALLLVVSPLHLTYSTRVKQYTLDALFAAVLLGLAWSAATGPGWRRSLWLFTAVAAVAVAVSPAVLPVVAVAWLVAVAPRRADLWPAPVSGAVLAAVTGAVLVWTRTATANPALGNSVAYGFVFAHGSPWRLAGATLRNLAPLPAGVTALLLAAGAVALVGRRPRLAVLAGGPVALALLLSAARVVPIAGRFESYLYPSLALLMAGGVDALAASRRRTVRFATVAAAAATGVSLAVSRTPPLPYPAEHTAPLVRLLEAKAGAGDAILSPFSTSYAFALYTSWPVRFEPSRRYLTGFRADVVRPGVTIIDPHYDIGWRDAAAGRLDPLPWSPALDRTAVARAVGTGGHRRVWLLGSRADRVVEDELRRLGFVEVARVAPRGGYTSLSEWLRG